jgi:hypothetical protein
LIDKTKPPIRPGTPARSPRIGPAAFFPSQKELALCNEQGVASQFRTRQDEEGRFGVRRFNAACFGVTPGFSKRKKAAMNRRTPKRLSLV